MKSIGGSSFEGCISLTSIISEIQNPFAIKDEFMFFCEDVDIYKTATLTVPAGTKEKYQSTEGWWKFLNIIENNSSDIMKAVTVTKDNHAIYDLNGRLLDHPQKGINIIGGKKLIIR